MENELRARINTELQFAAYKGMQRDEAITGNLQPKHWLYRLNRGTDSGIGCITR